MGVALSKYYLIITMVTATPEFGTDLFIFHQENENTTTMSRQTQCKSRLNICGQMIIAFENFQR